MKLSMVTHFTAQRNQTRCIKFRNWYRLTGAGISAIALYFSPVAIPVARGQTPEVPGLNLSQVEQTLRNVADEDVATAQIRLDGYGLFTIAAPAVNQNGSDNNSQTPISQRKENIEKTLSEIARSDFDPDKLTVTSAFDSKSGLPVISVNDRYLMTVTTLDAQIQGSDLAHWSDELTSIIKNALIRAKQERQPEYLMRHMAIAGGVFLGMVVASGAIVCAQRTVRKQKKELEAANEESTANQHATSDNHSIETPTVLHLQEQQQYSLNDVKRRVLQMGQVSLWGGGTLTILGLFPYTRWLQPLVLSAPLKVVGIGLGVYILIRLSDVVINRLFQVLEEGHPLSVKASQRLALRISTGTRVVKSATTLLLVGTGVLAGLTVLGVNLVPLLAGAGIIGVAISFASQNVIKDVINGFLILLEDQYAVGDVIVMGEVGGFVENMNLRITQLRDNEGRLITIPNSAISVVQNLSKDWSRVDFTIDVAFDTDPDWALNTLHQLAEEMYRDREWRSQILEPPEVLGIDEIDHAGLLIRVWIKTQPLQQWAVAREFRRRLKRVMADEQLQVGTPHRALSLSHSLKFDQSSVDGHKELLKNSR